MADIITFKKGLKAGLPSTALTGEPLFCMDTKELYIGLGPNEVPTCFISKEVAEALIDAGYKNILDLLDTYALKESIVEYKHLKPALQDLITNHDFGSYIR